MHLAAQQVSRTSPQQEVAVRDEPVPANEHAAAPDDDVIVGTADWQPITPKAGPKRRR
jgi:hypothetical protein